MIHEGTDDVIVAFISSRVPPRPALSELVITEKDPGLPETGLKVASVIRIDKIATLSRDLVEGEIGELSPVLADECNAVMGRFFRL